MGKLLQCDGAPVLDSFPQQCHASAMDPWRDSSLQVAIPSSPPLAAKAAKSLPSSSPLSTLPSLQLISSEGSSIPSLFTETFPLASWDSVPGLESQQIQALLKFSGKGVFWKHPCKATSCVFTLHHGGDVEADGNCLFSAAQKAMFLREESPQAVRKNTVQRFVSDYSNGTLPKAATDQAIKHLYSPDLASGWGVHVVQEVKLLAKKQDREAMETAIEELMQCSVSRDSASEMVYKERCNRIDNGDSWSKYMSIAGDANDEHDIITLLYAQEGLISIEENKEGRAAAFGDDIAIESLASEYHREIFVVQAHGADAMVDEEHCVFFLTHRPRGEILHHPIFLFMKGTASSCIVEAEATPSSEFVGQFILLYQEIFFARRGLPVRWLEEIEVSSMRAFFWKPICSKAFSFCLLSSEGNTMEVQPGSLLSDLLGFLFFLVEVESPSLCPGQWFCYCWIGC